MRREGFTLFEILAVVLLIALITAVLLTQVGGGFGILLHNAGRSIAGELEYASQRAVATGYLHRVVFDLDQQAFRIESIVPPTPPSDAKLPEHAEGLVLAPPLETVEFAPIEGELGNWRSLDDGDVVIEKVKIANEATTSGAVGVGFSPDGAADPAEISLHDDGGYALRIRLLAFTGEIRVEDVARE